MTKPAPGIKTDSPVKADVLLQNTEKAADGCLLEAAPEPCMIVILGASGDLTARKIIPSLFNLYLNGALPDQYVIVGCARSNMNSTEFRMKMKDSCQNSKSSKASEWKKFAEQLYYQKIDYEGLDSFVSLAGYLYKLSQKYGTHGNKIFYLAIPPMIYENTAEMLGKSGLSKENKNGKGWSRVVVEKPFGRDLTTAMTLDKMLHRYFKERQIFRIDHYLAKETVQNILMFRFANAIFEPIWNRNYIDHVNIIAAETLGVEHRAGYYEQAGVLRDMFQNHMMQLLALTAMEPPSIFEAERVRDEKAKVYRSLRPFPIEEQKEYLVLGQYGAGAIEGKRVPAYRDEPGVLPDSLIPTYAMIKLFVDNWRWKDVPFYLTSGKRMAEKRTEINIQFKKIPHSMFRNTISGDIPVNRLIMGIYPDEEISLTFQTKNPGAKMCLRPVNMDFHYSQSGTVKGMDAYEKGFLDCMLGDHTLFWRQDGVELCWSFLTPVLETCETCGLRSEMLLPYNSGTLGPKAFQDLKILFNPNAA